MEPKFEHSALEKDIQKLSQEVKKYKEGTAEALSDREIVKSIIGSKIQAVPAPGPQPLPEEQILPKYLEKESPEIRLKIEELIDLAFHRGIDSAIAEAKKFSPFILDALHDSLTGKIYEEMKRRELI